MTLETLRAPVLPALTAMNHFLTQELLSDVPFIQVISEHLTQNGGKRLRPLVLLLVADAFGFHESTEHIEIATVLEFVHTATLLHDDVVDESSERRGQITANAIWGNAGSVLTGDFLYSRAFQILARRNNIPVMRLLADTTNALSEGEVLQLTQAHDPHLTEPQYREIIRRKTALLYAAAAEIGARLATSDEMIHTQAHQYGLHVGLAFQLIDDLLDYTADPALLGKHVGDDLAEGKVTLPLLYTLQHTDPETRLHIEQAIQAGGSADVARIITAIRTTGADQYTLDAAKREATLALQTVQDWPHTSARTALAALTQFVWQREF
ncbi:MAG: octaprenyl diphosphate synthase [Gammaproteobacteria bacterium RIFCSPHIGHO2_12_FULL_45_9]|nr:MAG: octaprenyl diphosphate synthase [Gammaproteobacteria bacterium RIFCSPHIGHO2_12_FULL_45_9]